MTLLEVPDTNSIGDYIDGTGYIGTANVYDGGNVINGHRGGTGNIEEVNVYGGTVRNGNYFSGRVYYHGGEEVDPATAWGSTGNIGTANVYDGTVFNGLSFGTGYIDTANVYGGTVYNGEGESVIRGYNGSGFIPHWGGIGFIGTANVYDGTVVNGFVGGTGSIETVNVYGGEVINGIHSGSNTYEDFDGTGFIGTANVHNGTVYNGYDGGMGSIDTANVNGGELINNGTVETVNLKRGGGEYVYDGFGYGYYESGALGGVRNDGFIKTVNIEGEYVFGYRDHVGYIDLEYLNEMHNELFDIYGEYYYDGEYLYYDRRSVSGGTLINFTGTVETVNVNGGLLHNNGYIETANFHDGDRSWRGWSNNGTIETANIYGGRVLHNGMDGGTGYIETANVYGGAQLNNGDWGSTGYITTANIYDGMLTNGFEGAYGGTVANGGAGAGYIKTVDVHGGTVYNVSFNESFVSFGGPAKGVITTANIYDGGEVWNWGCPDTWDFLTGSAHIETVNVNGGKLYNGFWEIFDGYIDGIPISIPDMGYIATVNVNGGEVYNAYDIGSVGMGHSVRIGTLSLDGGFVSNAGRIDDLTFTAGMYEWLFGGSIGTLTLAGNSADNPGDWGIVENLAFTSDGSGILYISAFVEESFSPFGIAAMSAETPKIGFNIGINAHNIDFTYGNIFIDWNGALSEGVEFSILDLFGTEEIFGTLASLTIGEQQFFSVGSDWTFTFADGVWSSNAVPEPATLAIIGLGLAGLGLTRRRRK